MNNEILIVDDNKNNLKFMETCLHDAGYEVLIATNGEDAIKRALIVQPDLIVLDVMMPGLSGYETCEKLKEKLETKDIPVIFATAQSPGTDIETAFRVGGVDYITKPIIAQELLSRVATHLEIHRHRRELEQEIRDRTDRLLESEKQIRKISRVAELGTLTAGVAHEIRNPLAAVIQTLHNIQNRLTNFELAGNLDALKIAGISQQQLTSYLTERKIISRMGSIDESAKAISAIVDNMLSFSRTAELPFGMVLIEDLIQDALNVARFNKNFRKIENIEMHLEDNELKLHCSKGEMVQVLVNLLVNSAEAFGHCNEDCGPPTIKISVTVIPSDNLKHNTNAASQCPHIDTAESDTYVRISVSDNGPGIPEEHIAKVQNSFFTTKAEQGGTGLGLYICNQIVSVRHNGCITIKSVPYKETVFDMYLPVG